MDNIEQLFIRACKSKNPEIRLNSVYRRFYLPADKAHQRSNITHILARICSDYDLLSIAGMVTELGPENAWKYTSGRSYSDRCFGLLFHTIRLTEINKFKGMSVPRRFKEQSK